MTTGTAELNTFDLTEVTRTPFSRLVRVELRKSYDTRSGWWLLVGMGLLTVVIYAVMLLMVAFGSSHFSYGQYVAGAAYGTAVLLPIMAILLVTSEWSQRTAMTTFSLEPNRRRVILAKLATGLVLTAAVAAFAIVAGAFATVLSSVVGGRVSWDLGWNFLIGFVLTQALAMLSGFALATLLLNSPAAIVVFFLYKWVVPTVLGIVAMNVHSFHNVQPWIDFENAQRPLQDLSLHGSDWAHLVVTGVVWLGVPFVLGLRRVLRAEVK